MAATGAPQEPGRIRDPSLADDIIPLVTLAVLISGSLALSGLDALNGPIQVGLILCMLTALIMRPVMAARRVRSD